MDSAVPEDVPHADSVETPAGAGGLPRWRELWQVPVFLVAGGVLVSGLLYAFQNAPKPEVGGDLKIAAAQESAGNYGAALETLNTKVLPKLEKAASPEELREFHLLRARALYKGQKELGIDRPENNANVIREYEDAIKAHATLEELDSWFLANAYLSEGNVEECLKWAEPLESMPTQRTELLQRVIDQCMKGKPRNEPLAMDLLARLLTDPSQANEVKLWTVSRQAELLVDQGYVDDAITKTVRALIGLEQEPGNDEVLGEVHVSLAKAYVQANDREQALKHLARAEELLGESHNLMASVNLLWAGIEREMGEDGLAAAKERYLAVIEKFGFSDQKASALLGLAEVNSKMALDRPELVEEAIANYQELVEYVRSGEALGDATVDEIVASLMGRYRERFEQEEYDRAQRLAELAEQSTGKDGAGPEVFHGLAEAHKRTAERILRDKAGNSAISLAHVDPVTQREARTHLVLAGEYFRRHSEEVAESDNDAYGSSLWLAADAFDRAGDLDSSIKAFAQFAADFPADIRGAEAKFRQAQGYQARGDLELASKIYKELIEGREVEGTGAFADASIVPLAQTYLLDGDEANDQEAERLLTGVVAGSVGGTRTETFRSALIELGQFYYLSGQYERAIERFDEYLARAVSDSDPASNESFGRVREAMYKFADSNRLSAAAIRKDLTGEDRPEEEKRDLENKRVERLRKALQGYRGVDAELSQDRELTAIEELYLRNAVFYAGDCEFDLKDYDAAIRTYDQARERYPRDPAALVAMIQIVNALVAQGQVDRAQTANARAKRFYESLPDDVWDDPTLPMSREYWERWLDSQVKLGSLAKGSGS
jgi:tetratricopeptide (TPR) repeat protein